MEGRYAVLEVKRVVGMRLHPLRNKVRRVS